MKKNLGIILTILAFFGIGFCLYMEGKYSMTHVVTADMTEEQILTEMPDIAISEDDLALEEYVLSLPEVQDMLEWAKDSEFGGDIPDEKAEILLSDWIKEGWSAMGLSAIQDNIYFFYERGRTKYKLYVFC